MQSSKKAYNLNVVRSSGKSDETLECFANHFYIPTVLNSRESKYLPSVSIISTPNMGIRLSYKLKIHEN